jgi:diguanylate cyclase (GGDEF)-like protein
VRSGGINQLVRHCKTVFGFLFPGSFVLVLFIILVKKGYLDRWPVTTTTILPYVVLGTGFFLGLRFHRSRLAFAVLLFIGADRLLYFLGHGNELPAQLTTTVENLTAVLLPLNITILCLLKERGLLNPHGLSRACAFAAQALAVYVLLLESPAYPALLNRQITPLAALDAIGIPQPVLVVYAATLLLFLLAALLKRTPFIRGIFWALVSAAVGFHGQYTGTGSSVFFSVAGFVVTLSLLETAYSMAYHDELTGLPARRSLNTFVQGLGKNYVAAMLDIDFFKKFNDKYGHDVGDQVLCMVASHLKKVGGGGKPFRYGGEEFTIIFAGKTKKDAHTYLERLRESIAQAKFRIRGKNRPRKKPKTKRRSPNPKSVSVTVSIGASDSGGNFAKPAEIIKAADKALYRAKKKGRNCTVC